MLKAVIFLVSIFVLPVSLLYGQTLKGRVVEQVHVHQQHDDVHHVPLMGVNLYWSGTTIGTSTDSLGLFELKKIPDVNQLVVQYVGYETDTLLIGDQQEIELSLSQGHTLEEVTITFREKSISLDPLNPLNTHTMNEDELFKAACCNLSESFETNPSIDVSFTDAVTGSRQIQMLGLAGIYSMITVENMPMVRGLASIDGLTYIPGTWMQSIQVTKGTGSVANGYESITGQINAELKKPVGKEPEKLFANLYLNESGRTELNLNLSGQVSDKLSSGLLLHSAVRPFAIDRNEDTFMDNPTGENLMIMNRWQFNSKQWEAQVGIKGIRINHQAGQLESEVEKDSQTKPYEVDLGTDRLELWGKMGYVFPEKPYQSIGLQVSGIYHDHDATFGLNQYHGQEKAFYTNLIFQSIIGTSAHQYKIGLSYLTDDYDEIFNDQIFNRTEHVPGAFLEYTYKYFEHLTVVGGIRADYHNLYGLFFTPRLHARYGIDEKSTMRLSLGRGLRVANIFSENLGMMISARSPEIIRTNPEGAYGLNPEIAWNGGLNFTREFMINYREGSFSLDFYRTQFRQQVVVDREIARDKILFYNLEGKSFSNSFQTEVNYELIKLLDMRLAYRWYDVRTTFNDQLMKAPLVASHRAFLNLAYEGLRTWNFDYTFQWTGAKRIPGSAAVDMSNYSPDFTLMNAQITKTLGNLEVYLGVENLLDFRQDNPIMGAENPFSEDFDSAMIWGPVFGRMTYLGARFKLN